VPREFTLPVLITCRETTWELAPYFSYDANVSLIKRFTTLWAAPTEMCVDAVIANTSALVGDELKTHLGQFRELERFIG
jgi:hypothetical protein